MICEAKRRLIITMTNTSRQGEPKIVPQATLPLTATSAVDMIITEPAVFRFIEGQLALIELMPNVALEQVREMTGARFVEALK